MSHQQFVRSDYIPRARIVDASYKDRSVDEVTMGARCFLISYSRLASQNWL